MGMQNMRKRFRLLRTEISNDYPVTVRVSMDLDFGDLRDSATVEQLETPHGRGGAWDSLSEWDDFVWDGTSASGPGARTTGTGINASFLMTFEGSSLRNLAVQGYTVDFSPRSISRRGA